MAECSYQITQCDHRGDTIIGSVPAYMSDVVALLISVVGDFALHIHYDPTSGNFYRIERVRGW